MGIFDSFKKKRPDKNTREANQETSARPQQATPINWQVGDRVQNRYEVFLILGGPGKSGMGIVYICYDHEIKQAVAIKTFQDRFLQDRASIERFKWEAETWVRMEKHRNIVRAMYVDEIQGRPYIFLEYVVGDDRYGADLSGWIYGGGLTLPLTLNFAIQFCHGMIHADSKFIEMGKTFIHRDIKPSNIMITKDKIVKITDFGLVRAFAEPGKEAFSITSGDESNPRLGLSKSGNICGTPPYMSPEQCRGEKDIDIRSDIYSFGCVLYEMVTRKYVFDVRTPDEFMNYHLKTKPKPPNVQKELDRVIMKCLEKDPNNRYQDFSELEKVLSELYYRLSGDVVKQPEGAVLEAWEIFNEGVSLANLKLYEEAIGCYLKALQLNPENNYGVHNNLGTAYRCQGNLDAAVGEYKEAIRLDPIDAKAHYNLGDAYIAMGNLDVAIGEYKEALKLDPNDADAHCNLGVAYHDEGNLDFAIGEYKEALRLEPSDAKAHCNLGITYRCQGNLDVAIGEFKEALRLDPNNASAHANLGIAYKDQGKFEAALSEYREALRIKPNDASVHNNLGMIYKEQGNFDAAVGEWKEAVRLDQKDSSSHINLGNVYKAQGKLDAAIGEYREALKLEPNHTIAHSNLGNAYKVQGKLDAAIGEYKEAIRLDPNNPSAHNNLGVTYDEQGKLEAAIGEYKEALRLKPNLTEAHFNLGNIYEAQGKLGAAIEEYKEALRINPKLTEARYNLGNAYKAQGKLDAAIEEYKEALRINPNYAHAHYALGCTYKHQSKFKEAIGCYREFIRLAPPQDTSYLRQAEEDIRQLEQKL